LLLQVPLHWGLLHQAGALVVFGFAVANWRGFYGEYPHETMIAERD
jgi:cytochrome c oxidase assembly protein subunit 15